MKLILIALAAVLVAVQCAQENTDDLKAEAPQPLLEAALETKADEEGTEDDLNAETATDEEDTVADNDNTSDEAEEEKMTTDEETSEEDKTTVEATNNDEEEKGKVVKLSRSRGPLVTLYRFWNRKNTDHFYTTNPAKYCLDGYKRRGSWCKRYRDYRYAKNVGRIYKRKYGNIVYPLYRAYNSRIRDHFYTTNCQEVLRAQKHGWKYQGVEGYCFKQYLPGINSPLYRYWRRGKDHFYTTNRNTRYWGMASSVARKYKYEGVACYVVI